MRGQIKNYYQILGLPWDSSGEDIRKAYRIYAAKFHPDKHAGDPFFEERFKEVKEAYEILGDAEKRWNYDIKVFGRSKVVLNKGPGHFDNSAKSEKGEGERARRKFRVDIGHLDIYIAAFYFINLAAWAIIRKMNENAMPGGYLWALFLSGLSSLLLWLFISGLTDRTKGRTGTWFYKAVYLLVGLALGYVVLWTRWTPYR